MGAIKYSRQREALLKELRSRKDHPTADTLYQKLREDYPKISLGTVYRNLALLCEMGEIKKIPCGDGSERYDGYVAAHDHFVCSGCGRVIDLDGAVMKTATKVNNKEIGCVDDYSLIYYGLCKECLKKQKNGGN